MRAGDTQFSICEFGPASTPPPNVLNYRCELNANANVFKHVYADYSCAN